MPFTYCAEAQPLPAAQYSASFTFYDESGYFGVPSGTVTTEGGQSLSAETFSYSSPVGECNAENSPASSTNIQASGTVLSPFVSVGGNIGSTFSQNAITAQSSVMYYIEPTGPPGSGGDSITVSVAGTFIVQATPLSFDDFGYGSIIENASSSVSINYGEYEQDVAFATNLVENQSTAVATTNSYSTSIELIVGTNYLVQVSASMGLTATYPDSVAASASADPTFALAPSSVAAGYSIAYSPGLVPPPVLNLIPANGSITLQWSTNAVGFNLYQTAALSGSPWSQATTIPATNGANYSVTLPIGTGNQFFRLTAP